MPRFKVAHINQQGTDLIVVPLDDSFGSKDSSEQRFIIDSLQKHATGAALRGTVVPVWNSGGGRMAFIAPPAWHPFFKSIGLEFIARNLNKEIYW
jgi:hypothetical protein